MANELFPPGAIRQGRTYFKGEKIIREYLKDTACQLIPQSLKIIKKILLKRYTGFILTGFTRFDFTRVKVHVKCRYIATIDYSTINGYD